MSPKHHAPYVQIIHSLIVFSFYFFCFVFFCLVFCLFVCVCVCFKSFSIPKKTQKENKKKKPTKKNLPIHDFVLLLQQTTFRAPFSEERSRRHWVSVWCKTACFGWNTLPPPCSGTVQPRDWSGGGVCLLFFFFLSPFQNFFFFPPLCGVARRSTRSRCASSCEEPDGQTWRNICHSDCI